MIRKSTAKRSNAQALWGRNLLENAQKFLKHKPSTLINGLPRSALTGNLKQSTSAYSCITMAAAVAASSVSTKSFCGPCSASSSSSSSGTHETSACVRLIRAQGDLRIKVVRRAVAPPSKFLRHYLRRAIGLSIRSLAS
jgi:hypothetical protein